MNAADVLLLRQTLNLSQRDLARALNVSPATVVRWERPGGPEPVGLQQEVLRVLHATALEVRRRDDANLGRALGATIALGIGAFLMGALVAEITRAKRP